MANAVQAQQVSPGGMAVRWAWRGAALLGLAALGLLFWLNWKLQFAAPPGYLFDMRSPEAEAGYCLAVAQDFGRDPVSAEAADFWVVRLARLGRGMGRPIAEGRVALSRDQAAAAGARAERLRDAMLNCADRAVTYGARFRPFR